MLEALPDALAERNACGQQTTDSQCPDEIRSASAQGRVVTRRVDELRPHPSFVRHQLMVPVAKLSAAASQPDNSVLVPLAITHEQVILDGYAEWDLARMQGRSIVPCIEYELGEEEALRWLVRSHRRVNRLERFLSNPAGPRP